ncbi:MAG: hypothetical protein U1F68_04840 [Gammaproteobacteria bacterium]
MKPEAPSGRSPTFAWSDRELSEPLGNEPLFTSRLRLIKARLSPPRLFIYDPDRGHVATRVSGAGFRKLSTLRVSDRNLERAHKILRAAGFNPAELARCEDKIVLGKLIGGGELGVDWLRAHWGVLCRDAPAAFMIRLILGQWVTFTLQRQQTEEQDQARAGAAETARRLANGLIDDGGKVDTDAVAVALEQLQGHFYRSRWSPDPHGPHLDRMLACLSKDAGLRAQLQSIRAPAPVAADLVRATLGLPATHCPTATDARRAVLAALLADLRQGWVGSCFVTCLAIQVHEEQPDWLVRDLKALVEDGRLVVGQGEVPLNCSADAADNPLLRAWEYSLANLAENGRASHYTATIVEGCDKLLGDAWRDYHFRQHGQPPTTQQEQARDGLAQRACELFKRRMRLLYDAAALRERRDDDGRSERGGFLMQFRSGEDDAWQAIANGAAFTARIGAILQTVVPGPCPDLQDYLNGIIETALRDLKKGVLLDYLKANLRPPGKSPGYLQTDPWRIMAGGLPQPVFENYFGRELKPSVINNEGGSGKQLLAWMVGRLADQRGNLPASVLICGPAHAFLLKPGVPSMDEALNLAEAVEAADASAWIEDHLVQAGKTLIIGDSNWGFGAQHLYFALRYNAAAKDLELWNAAYDGARFALLAPQPNQAAWIGGRWEMFPNLGGAGSTTTTSVEHKEKIPHVQP